MLGRAHEGLSQLGEGVLPITAHARRAGSQAAPALGCIDCDALFASPGAPHLLRILPASNSGILISKGNAAAIKADTFLDRWATLSAF